MEPVPSPNTSVMSGTSNTGGTSVAPGEDAAPGAATRASVTGALASCSFDLYKAFLPAGASGTFHGRYVVGGEPAPKPARETDEIPSLDELAAMLDALDG